MDNHLTMLSAQVRVWLSAWVREWLNTQARKWLSAQVREQLDDAQARVGPNNNVQGREGLSAWVREMLLQELRCGIVDFGHYNFSNLDLSRIRVGPFATRYQALMSGYDGDTMDFYGAHFTDTNLTGADLRWIFFENADFTRANLQGANLADAELAGATLTGVDLTDAGFDENTNLTNAILTNVQRLQIQESIDRNRRALAGRQQMIG